MGGRGWVVGTFVGTIEAYRVRRGGLVELRFRSIQKSRLRFFETQASKPNPEIGDGARRTNGSGDLARSDGGKLDGVGGDGEYGEGHGEEDLAIEVVYGAVAISRVKVLDKVQCVLEQKGIRTRGSNR